MAVSIRAEHINPFIVSTMETFSTMVSCAAQPGKLVLKKHSAPDHEISGIIGLSGILVGSVAMSFPKATAIAVCNKFMSADFTEVNGDILDAVGELVNIVAGNAKKGLAEFKIEISLPNVIVGPNHRVVEPKGALSFVVPFSTPYGGFHMTVSLKPA